MVGMFAALLLVAGEVEVNSGVSARALIETVDIGGLSVSPDGRWLAFSTRQADVRNNRYRLTWLVAPTDMATPPKVVADGGESLWTDAGVPVSEPPSWLPDSRSFVFRALTNGAIGLWRASPLTTVRTLVARDDADIRSVSVDPDNGRISYRVGASRAMILAAEQREYADGIFVDATVDLAQAVYQGAMINGRRATQRLAGRWFARRGLLADLPDRDVTMGTPAADEAAARWVTRPPVRPPADGRAAAIIDANDGHCVSVTNPPPVAPGGPLTIRRCFAAHVASVAWWPGQTDVLVALQDGGFAQTLIDWRPGAGRLTEFARSPGLIAGSEDPAIPCALGRAAAFCVTAAAGAPPTLVRIARRDGRRTILYAPNRDLMTGFTGTIRGLEWRNEDGVRFYGQLFLPKHTRRVPLFVTYYRCPGFVRGGLGDEWPLAMFADAGIAALCVNKPPGTGRGVLAQPHYDLALSGVTAIIKTLARDGAIDSTRVGMGGLSFGSEVTMWAAMKSRLLRAVSIASLQLEPAYYWMNGVAGRDNHDQLAATWGLGAPEATPAQWRLMAPALNLDRLDAPILMQLPEQEGRTMMELYARLTHSPTPAELYVFPDEPHILIQPSHRLAAYQRNLDWFRFWLQDRVDPVPAKAAQYQRWQALSVRWHAGQSSQARAQSSMPRRSNSRK